MEFDLDHAVDSLDSMPAKVDRVRTTGSARG
jgi:hypothetical protein